MSVKVLLETNSRITFGLFRFIFKFTVKNEAAFQDAKKDWIQKSHGEADIFEVGSATPSASDVQVQGWRIQGVAGRSQVSIIHAATQIQTGKVAAVKRLYSGTEKERRSENDVQKYEDLLRSIKAHRYSKFLMRKHALLSNQHITEGPKEVYLLLIPLVRRTFAAFGTLGHWQFESKTIKLTLFAQILLRLMALHELDTSRLETCQPWSSRPWGPPTRCRHRYGRSDTSDCRRSCAYCQPPWDD